MSGSTFVKRGGLPSATKKNRSKLPRGTMCPAIYRQMFGEIAKKIPKSKTSKKK